MKKVSIIYNPFLLTTVITIDGKKTSKNSSINFNGQRVQEWAENLPKYLLKEYKDRNVQIEFKGTLDDFNDMKEILQNQHDIEVCQLVHHRTPDVEEVEKEVTNIFQEIVNGPIDSLKNESIIDEFKKAMRSEFAINVVATMSSGKSTLINSLLGRRLMPMGQMATTATIVRIFTTPNQDFYSGIAYDKVGKEVCKEKDLNIKIMRGWNNNPDISQIDIYGPVPCAGTAGMRLVLIDTPGPNNSRDEHHRELTYNMLSNSDKSMVLFVLNAEQLNINDEKYFMDYVCNCMKEGGKQSRDRYIFAVNKINSFKPEDGDDVEDALKSVVIGLDERDIKQPNIFPVGALTTLEIRTHSDSPETVPNFKNKCEKDGQFHLEKYYDFNHLPLTSRKRLEEKAKESDEAALEVHTGIPSVEEAIRLYVNKYARTIKDRDLVYSFNNKLKELNAEAELIDSIKDNESDKQKLEKEISKIEDEIQTGRSAKDYIKLIDNINVIDEVTEDVEDISGTFQTKIDNIIRGYNNDTKVPKDKALKQIKDIDEQRIDIDAQLKAQLTKVFEREFKRTYKTAIDIYRERLERLGFKSKDGNYEFNPIDYVGCEMGNLDQLFQESTEVVDEGHHETRTIREAYQEKKTNWFWTPWNWGTERYETKYRDKDVQVWIKNEVEYVDMKKVVNEYFVPFQTMLIEQQEGIPQHIENETTKLKDHLKKEFAEIEKILSKKLGNLKQMLNNAAQTQAEIDEQKRQLEWMRGIISRINKLVNY